jgi:hypothetical protein
MNLDTACNIIENFVLANQVDPLTGVELMVKYYKQISPKERQALCIFMDSVA